MAKLSAASTTTAPPTIRIVVSSRFAKRITIPGSVELQPISISSKDADSRLPAVAKRRVEALANFAPPAVSEGFRRPATTPGIVPKGAQLSAP